MNALQRILATTVVAMGPLMAHAQEGDLAPEPRCGELQLLLTRLEKSFGETVKYTAIAGSGNPLVLVLNAQTKSWTMLLMMNPIVACVVATGSHWGIKLPMLGEPA